VAHEARQAMVVKFEKIKMLYGCVLGTIFPGIIS